MRKKQRRLLGAIAAGVSLSALSACNLLPGTTFKDESVVTEEIKSVRLDSGDGNVTIKGAENADQVSIQRSVDYRGDKPQGKSHSVEDGVLVLAGCGSDCSVSYTVELPAGLPVSGGTRNGSITLSRVGDVDVSTGDGAISLDQVSGKINVRSSNGRIDGTGLAGTSVKAQTSNGAVDLTLSKPQGVWVKTNNGKVDLTVPEHSYQVTTTTSNGKQNVNITEDPQGEFLLDLTTGNGHININPA